MINIVLDNLETSNVWSTSRLVQYDTYFIKRFSHLFYFADISIHNSADNLDTFFYPILMHEPYIQCRSLTLNSSDSGFWAHISDSVIQGLREKRGWIIIDMYSEPILTSDFTDMINGLSDSSQFPNDRILINTVVSKFVDNERVFNFPSFLEMGCLVMKTKMAPTPCTCSCVDLYDYRKDIRNVVYPHKRFLLLNSNIDNDSFEYLAQYAEKYPGSFLDSSRTIKNKTHLCLPNALYATDVNVVPEAYVNFDMLDYPFITEKIFRNIKFKKPFIVMGQQHLLASFRKLGYKTFHPLINESYDTIVNVDKRCKAVLIELNRLRKMSDVEFNNLLEECKPIVEHNYNNLISRIKETNIWLERLKKV